MANRVIRVSDKKVINSATHNAVTTHGARYIGRHPKTGEPKYWVPNGSAFRVSQALRQGGHEIIESVLDRLESMLGEGKLPVDKAIVPPPTDSQQFVGFTLHLHTDNPEHAEHAFKEVRRGDLIAPKHGLHVIRLHSANIKEPGHLVVKGEFNTAHKIPAYASAFGEMIGAEVSHHLGRARVGYREAAREMPAEPAKPVVTPTQVPYAGKDRKVDGPVAMSPSNELDKPKIAKQSSKTVQVAIPKHTWHVMPKPPRGYLLGHRDVRDATGSKVPTGVVRDGEVLTQKEEALLPVPPHEDHLHAEVLDKEGKPIPSHPYKSGAALPKGHRFVGGPGYIETVSTNSEEHGITRATGPGSTHMDADGKRIASVLPRSHPGVLGGIEGKPIQHREDPSHLGPKELDPAARDKEIDRKLALHQAISQHIDKLEKPSSDISVPDFGESILSRLNAALEESVRFRQNGRFARIDQPGGAQAYEDIPKSFRTRCQEMGGKVKRAGAGIVVVFADVEKSEKAFTAFVAEGIRVVKHDIPGILFVETRLTESHDLDHMIATHVDSIPGGKGSGKDPASFDKAQLQAGVNVEMEHTRDPHQAMEIAMDHLTENPEYYTDLYDAGIADEPGADPKKFESAFPDPEGTTYADPAQTPFPAGGSELHIHPHSKYSTLLGGSMHRHLVHHFGGQYLTSDHTISRPAELKGRTDLQGSRAKAVDVTYRGAAVYHFPSEIHIHDPSYLATPAGQALHSELTREKDTDAEKKSAKSSRASGELAATVGAPRGKMVSRGGAEGHVVYRFPSPRHVNKANRLLTDAGAPGSLVSSEHLAHAARFFLHSRGWPAKVHGRTVHQGDEMSDPKMPVFKSKILPDTSYAAKGVEAGEEEDDEHDAHVKSMYAKIASFSAAAGASPSKSEEPEDHAAKEQPGKPKLEPKHWSEVGDEDDPDHDISKVAESDILVRLDRAIAMSESPDEDFSQVFKTSDEAEKVAASRSEDQALAYAVVDCGDGTFLALPYHEAEARVDSNPKYQIHATYDDDGRELRDNDPDSSGEADEAVRKLHKVGALHREAANKGLTTHRKMRMRLANRRWYARNRAKELHVNRAKAVTRQVHAFKPPRSTKVGHFFSRR